MFGTPIGGVFLCRGGGGAVLGKSDLFVGISNIYAGMEPVSTERGWGMGGCDTVPITPILLYIMLIHAIVRVSRAILPLIV